jgi:hypothetical protein
MNKIFASFLFVIWLFGCKKSTPETPTDICFTQLQPVDQTAYLFVKEVDDASTNRQMDKNIYLNEVVGSWKFVCSKIVQPKQFCYSYYRADSMRNIVFDFKPAFTYTYITMDSIGFSRVSKAKFGKGRLDSLFRSSFPNSDIDLTLKSPKGGKMFMGFYPIIYTESYFKKL